ncbi:MAG: hypothetical protein Kow0020_13860 [Wenzhouxiangellaceae bacterium]
MSTEAVETIAEALASGALTVTALDDGTGVLLDMSGERLITLNDTAMCLVEGIEAGERELDALVRRLVRRFDVPTDQARADAASFVARLAEVLDAG